MTTLYYESGSGGVVIPLDVPGSLAGFQGDIKGHEWSYGFSARGIVNAARNARKAEIPYTGNEGEYSRLMSVADRDIENATPGRIHYNGWRQHCYVTASSYNIATPRRASMTITIALLDGAWWREVSVPFAITENIDEGNFLGYPYGYMYDFGRPALVKTVTVDSVSPCPVMIRVYGPAINPYIIIGDNTYRVNVSVPSGGRLEIDGLMKTIFMIGEDGTKTDCFRFGVRSTGEGGGNYIFEKLQPGEQPVAWDNSFAFDAGWHEMESEPSWTA